MSKIKLTGKSKLFKKKISSINRRDLNLAMSEATECGSGINALKGFVSLPNFNPESGDKEGFHGFYFVDGELVTDTVPNIKEEIKSFCNGPQEPQALRLTFDSIENANTLVGDASDVNDWNTFFDLPTYGTPFSAVTISGSTIQLFGGSDIVLRDYLFDYDGNASLLEFNDLDGCIISSGYFVFGAWDYGSCINLATLILPSIIDAKTFQELSSLTIFIAPLLEILGDNTGNGNGLSQCTSLITIDLPSLTTAGNNCFYQCTGLTTVNFPNLTTAGNNCFQYCTSLTTVDLPSLTTAGNLCFYDCTLLTTVNLPNLTTTGIACFYNCITLTTVNLPSLITAYDQCFDLCTSLTTVNLPSLITAGGFCFRSCPLTTIDLPSLTTVGDSFFEDCTSLTTINIPSCTNLGGTIGDDNVFYGITGNTITLTVPAALMTANAGSPDGDIAYLQANNTVTVVTV